MIVISAGRAYRRGLYPSSDALFAALACTRPLSAAEVSDCAFLARIAMGRSGSYHSSARFRSVYCVNLAPTGGNSFPL